MVHTSGSGVVSSVFSIPLQVGPSSTRPRRGRERASGVAVREFIGDGENFLVPRAAEAVLQYSPEFNPIVFHGPSGTGKTFLARGLVQLWNARYPQRTAVVTTGADFARDYANSIEADSLSDLRNRFRSAALILIDDLDTLQTKPAAQCELVHLLDAQFRHHRQVLVTLKQAALETAGLLAPLASRLSGGLAVPLTAPGPAARRVILEHLLALHGLRLTDEALETAVLEPLSSPHKSLPDFAALQQFVLRLAAAPEPSEGAFDAQAVHQALAHQETSRGVHLKSISQQVARYFNVRVAELKGATRQQRVVRARGVAMLLARQLTEHSLEQVGRHFGNRDHTTVLHACRKTEALISSDLAIRQAVQELATQLAHR